MKEHFILTVLRKNIFFILSYVINKNKCFYVTNKMKEMCATRIFEHEISVQMANAFIHF